MAEPQRGQQPAQQRSTRRYRVYQGIGIAAGVLFLALGIAAFFAGGGPIVGTIGVVGGVVCLTAAIVTAVRT